jgi:hypothetical protein
MQVLESAQMEERAARAAYRQAEAAVTALHGVIHTLAVKYRTLRCSGKAPACAERIIGLGHCFYAPIAEPILADGRADAGEADAAASVTLSDAQASSPKDASGPNGEAAELDPTLGQASADCDVAIIA